MGYAEAQYIIDEVNQRMDTNINTGLPIANVDCRLTDGPNGSVNIFFEIKDLTLDEANGTLARFGSCEVRIKKDSAPKDTTDGTFVAKFEREDMAKYKTEAYVYAGELESGETYYLRFFPQTDHGVVSYNRDLIFEFIPSMIQVFGFRQDFKDKNPDTQITYLSYNKNYRPMHTNVDTGSFTMGSWDNWTWLNKVTPMIVDRGLNVIQLLDKNDYEKTTSGSNSNIHMISDFGCFVWIPKLYYKEEWSENGTVREVQFTDDEQWVADHPGFEKNIFTIRTPGTSGWITSESTLRNQRTDCKGFFINMFPIGIRFNSYGSDLEKDYNGGKDIRVSMYSDIHNSNTNYRHLIGWAPGFTTPSTHDLFRNPSTNYRNAIGSADINHVNFFRDIIYLLIKSTDILKHCGYGYRYLANAYTDGRAFNQLEKLPEPDYKYGAFYGHGKSQKKCAKLFHSMVLGTGISRLAPIQSSGTEYSSYDYNIYNNLNNNGKVTIDIPIFPIFTANGGYNYQRIEIKNGLLSSSKYYGGSDLLKDAPETFPVLSIPSTTVSSIEGLCSVMKINTATKSKAQYEMRPFPRYRFNYSALTDAQRLVENETSAFCSIKADYNDTEHTVAVGSSITNDYSTILDDPLGGSLCILYPIPTYSPI